MLFGCLLFYGFASPAAAHRPVRRRFPDQFGNPNGRDEFLHAVVIEIDRCAFSIGFCDRAKTILIVADRLTLRQNLHGNLLGFGTDQCRPG